MCCACQADPPDEGRRVSPPAVGQQRQALTAPESVSTKIRQVGAEYRIEVACPKGFPPRAFNPQLHVGTTVFGRYRAVPDAGIYAVYYPMSEAEFEALSDGAPLVVKYGAEHWQDFGTLDKSAVIEEAP